MSGIALPFPVPNKVMESLKDSIAPEQFPPPDHFDSFGDEEPAFARRLGIPATTLNTWKLKGTIPRTRNLSILLSAFHNDGLIVRWLQHGSYDPAREDLSDGTPRRSIPIVGTVQA
jgi:hypothetical protein